MAGSDHRVDQIGAAIRAQVLEQSQAIVEQANRERNRVLQELNERMTAKMFEDIQSAVHQFHNEGLREVSRREQQEFHALLTRREELTARVFEAVDRRLAEFASGPDYAAWLLREVESLRDLCDHSGSRLLLRREDRKLADQAAALLPGCTVEESDAIRLGGFLLENAALSLEADCTLETRLQEQRPWFLTRCGLRVRKGKEDAGHEQ